MAVAEHIYKKIWEKVTKIRGSIDAWEFKDYILGFLFYRYISEDFSNYVSKIFKLNYEDLNDVERIEKMKETLIEEKGYFIYPKHLFVNIRKKAAIDYENLNEEIQDAFKNIEESTQQSDSRKDFEGLFELIDLTNKSLGIEVVDRNKKIKEVLNVIAEINLTTENINFGDVYEYLIGEYAAGAGKTGGEYFTPKEVSQLIAKLVQTSKTEIREVHDPACGSGSLLLQLGNNPNLKFYGQENNHTTYNICRINMFLHKIEYNNFDIAFGNTLENDQFENMKFDVVISNPPFSNSWRDNNDDVSLKNDPRFNGPGVLAPKDKSDYAFILHALWHLKDEGIAVIVVSPGILFRDNSAEKKIRKWLVDNNRIDAIISLTNNLFFGVGVAACLLILKKRREIESIKFINATECFSTETRKKISEENINTILELYKNNEDVENLSKNISLQKIKEKDYLLSVEKYINMLSNENETKENIEETNKKAIDLSNEINKLNDHMNKLIENF